MPGITILMWDHQLQSCSFTSATLPVPATNSNMLGLTTGRALTWDDSTPTLAFCDNNDEVHSMTLSSITRAPCVAGPRQCMHAFIPGAVGRRSFSRQDAVILDPKLKGLTSHSDVFLFKPCKGQTSNQRNNLHFTIPHTNDSRRVPIRNEC